jgi:hypothetical protein
MPDGDQLALAEIFPPGADEEFLAQAEGQIRGYGKLVVSGIVEIGRKLVEVQGRLPGRYVAFVTERLGWSKMQASRFVNVYEMLKGNNLLPSADDLTIDASSDGLSAPLTILSRWPRGSETCRALQVWTSPAKRSSY